MNGNQEFRVTSPNQMNQIFAAAFNSGKIENLLALYADDAVLIDQTGKSLTGQDAIKRELLALLELGGKMTSENQYVYQQENIALLRAKWFLETQNVQGDSYVIEGESSEVVKQQSDGSWLYLIDHPFGANSLT